MAHHNRALVTHSPEQSEALALISPEYVASTDCVQQAEAVAAETHRTLAQARPAVATAMQNRSVSPLLPVVHYWSWCGCPPSKIHLRFDCGPIPTLLQTTR